MDMKKKAFSQMYRLLEKRALKYLKILQPGFQRTLKQMEC
jgi:hypothetical protein